MRRKLPFLFLGLFVSLGLVGLFVWQRYGKIAPAMVRPFSAPDDTFSLSLALEKAGIVPDGPPEEIGDTIIASISGRRVLFAADSDLETQARALQLVLPRLKMEERIVREVDLRFNKVVFRK